MPLRRGGFQTRPYEVNRICRGGFQTSPYMIDRARIQDHNAVHMIGHDCPGVQLHMGIVLRQLFPYGLCQAAGRAKAQFAFCYVTEDTCPFPCADSDEVRARLAVIKPRQPYGLPTARRNVAEPGGFERRGKLDRPEGSQPCACPIISSSSPSVSFSKASISARISGRPCRCVEAGFKPVPTRSTESVEAGFKPVPTRPAESVEAGFKPVPTRSTESVEAGFKPVPTRPAESVEAGFKPVPTRPAESVEAGFKPNAVALTSISARISGEAVPLRSCEVVAKGRVSNPPLRRLRH